LDSADLDRVITDVLETAKNIAIVGMSDDLERPSFRVGMYLKTHHYHIIPVNPNHADIKGIKSYPTISAIPQDIKIDVVDIFRKPADVFPHVREAVARGVKVIWMQRGIINEEAASYARANGSTVIMDRCMMGEYHKRHVQP